jgi:uncharacterized protein
MYAITQIFIYPIKSLGGISLTNCKVEERGLQYDRRWVLCDENNKFISQREFKQLALFKLGISDEGFTVTYLEEKPIVIPFSISGSYEKVEVWDDICDAVEHKSGSEWFTAKLSFACKLFYMPDDSKRFVNAEYAFSNEITSFTDGYPILITGQKSLDDLNGKLTNKIEISRFRPNIVFDGGKAFDEDSFSVFSINQNIFKGVKACARCLVVNIDQTTGVSNIEPLQTLAQYRNKNNKVLFGRNAIVIKSGKTIQTGDIIVLNRILN